MAIAPFDPTRDRLNYNKNVVYKEIQVFTTLEGQVMAEICCEKPVRTGAVSDVERGTLIREASRG